MNLLFRTDASVAIGTGHAMRCLALGQAWQDAGGRAVFAMSESTASIDDRLRSETFELFPVSCVAGSRQDANQTIALARELQAEWIVVDGYQFDAKYQRVLKSAGFKVLFFDDYGHVGHYSADLVLNQNVCARRRLYRDREPQTRLLLGSRYCLLRREFDIWREWRRDVSRIGRRVLVTMGGSDPENLTARVVKALALVRVEELDAIVVVGGSSVQPDLIESIDARRGTRISVRRDVTNMAELMAWADVAVSSAGSTCWELCLLGLPMLLVDVADNQTAVAQELDRQRCAIHLGGVADFSEDRVAQHLEDFLKLQEKRHSISMNCRGLVDGMGAKRVVSAMRSWLNLRQAQENDCRLLWEWANDPTVRGAAFSREPIPWEKHEAWLASKMKDPDCRILVAEDDKGRAIGQFRVDWRSDRDGEIDVSVSSERRGAGYGAVLIDLGVSSAFAERGECLHAFVKTENQASRAAFEQAGFTQLDEEDKQGQRVIHYIRNRDCDQNRSE